MCVPEAIGLGNFKRPNWERPWVWVILIKKFKRA